MRLSLPRGCPFDPQIWRATRPCHRFEKRGQSPGCFHFPTTVSWKVDLYAFAFTAVHMLIGAGKPYYWPYPCSAVIEPGEEASIRVVAMVDERTAPSLSLNETDMHGRSALIGHHADDQTSLSYRLKAGKTRYELRSFADLADEQFITLSASFQPTIVGLPLHLISSLSKPVRSLSASERKDLIPLYLETSEEPLLSSTTLLRDELLTPTSTSPTKSPGPNPPMTQFSLAAERMRDARPPRQIWKLLEALMDAKRPDVDIWAGSSDQARDAIEVRMPTP